IRSVDTCVAFSFIRIRPRPGMIVKRLSALVRLAGEVVRPAPTLAPADRFLCVAIVAGEPSATRMGPGPGGCAAASRYELPPKDRPRSARELRLPTTRAPGQAWIQHTRGG